MSNATKTAKRSDFKKYFQFMWRSLNIQASWNYERQMNMGFLYGIAPTLDELYPNENDPEQLAHKKEAYEREMAFYNCTPQTSAFTLGLAASMEEHGGFDYPHYLRKHRSGAAGCAEQHSAEPSEPWHRDADVHPDPQKGQDRLAAGHLHRGRCCHQRPWSVGVTGFPAYIDIRTPVICDSSEQKEK